MLQYIPVCALSSKLFRLSESVYDKLLSAGSARRWHRHTAGNRKKAIHLLGDTRRIIRLSLCCAVPCRASSRFIHECWAVWSVSVQTSLVDRGLSGKIYLYLDAV